jgi:hypothetical protein
MLSWVEEAYVSTTRILSEVGVRESRAG